MSNDIKINNKTFSIVRLNLKGWAYLDELRDSMDNAASRKDFDSYFISLVKFIEAALFPIPKNINWKEVPWNDVIEIFSKVSLENYPKIKFPVLEAKKKEKEKLPWEYNGRSWYFWLNLFSRVYGWKEEDIEKLDIDSAIGLYQEIIIDDQLSKEWQWGLSEVSKEYNASTKTSKFVPLERPDWMKPIVQAPKKIKIRRDLLPIGEIKDLEEEQRIRNEKKGI